MHRLRNGGPRTLRRGNRLNPVYRVNEDTDNFAVTSQQSHFIHESIVPATEARTQRLGLALTSRRPQRRKRVSQPMFRDGDPRLSCVQTNALRLLGKWRRKDREHEKKGKRT
jgi:hypothetical protein